MAKQRLLYIDNLRIFLIALVVLHHFAITYGAPGGWYYNESEAGFPEVLLMAMFVASNQAFFMGMFFFISSFFLLPSLQRKGNKKFVADRLIRLGIPLLFFFFILSPVSIYIRNRFIYHENITLLNYLFSGNGTGFGPLWFVEAMLIFTFVFLLFRRWVVKLKFPFPGTGKILLGALFIGVLQFIIRLWLPVGWSMPFTNFQFPFFVQYIVLFVFGIIVYQNNWLESINGKMGWKWFMLAQLFVFIGFPLLFILGGAAENGTVNFMGGLTWQSFAYALWEQILCVSLIIGLLGMFKKRINSQNKLTRHLSDSAYAVFIFHTPVIIGLAAIFVNWKIFPPLKFIMLAPLALLACFLIASLVKQIPGVKKVI